MNLLKGRDLVPVSKILNTSIENLMSILETPSQNADIQVIETAYEGALAGSEEENVIRWEWLYQLISFYEDGTTKFVIPEVKKENAANYLATIKHTIEIIKKLTTADELSKAHGESDIRNVYVGNYSLLKWIGLLTDSSELSKAYLVTPNGEESIDIKKYIIIDLLEMLSN